MTKDTRIVMAFSGGTDAAEAVQRLARDRTVIAMTLDLGQGHELTGVRERALASGAARAHVLDVRDALARDYFWTAVRSGRSVVSRPGDLLVPVVASKLVEIARIEDAAAVAHEWSGEDASRLAEAVHRLAPELTVIAPVAGAGLSCADEATLWSSSRVTAAGFELTRPAAEAPQEGASIALTFESGFPTRLNGIEMSLVEMIESVETIAGAHAVGRVQAGDGWWIDAPAAVVLEIAYGALVDRISDPGRALDGTVALRLAQGACVVVSCTAADMAVASAERQ